MNSTLKKIIVFVSLATLLLELSGFVSPWWFILQKNITGDIGMYLSDKVSVGLWYGVYCDLVKDETSCSIYSHADYAAHIKQMFGEGHITSIMNDMDHNLWVKYSIEATFSILACLVGVVSVWVVMLRPSQEARFRVWVPITGIAYLLSGILIWIPVGALIEVYKAFAILEKLTTAIESKTPYSLILSGCGGVMAFIDVLLLVKLWYDEGRKWRSTPPPSSRTINFQMQTIGAEGGYCIANPYQHGAFSQAPPPYDALPETANALPVKEKN